MAQVPYTGVPQVEPSPRGLEVSTPPDAFGVGVAQAVEGLGKDIGQAGNELWDRAVALKQLQNETEAKDADIQFMLEVGEKHAKFNALEGQDRVAAFPGYSKDLQDTYRKYRAGLSNDYARRMFDSTAVSTMSRSIFNGAGAAATAQKEWMHTSTAARMDLNEHRVADNPTDQGEFDQRINEVRPAARDLAATSPGGWSQEREDDLTMKGESRLWYNKVFGIAKVDPPGAAKMLDDNRNHFTDTDWKAADNLVRSSARTVGSDNIALNVLDKHRQDDGTYDVTFKEMVDETRKSADKIWADRDPEMAKYAVQQLEHHYNQDGWAKRQDDVETMKKIDETIAAGATTVNQFPPELRRRMTPSQLLKAQGMINNYVRSQHVATNDQIYQKLLGLWNNDQVKFMELNPMAIEGINKTNIDFIRKLQRTAPGGDPRVPRAMTWLRGARASEMQSLGVFGRDKQNPDDYDRLTGAMHEAIQAYQETHGKAPDEKAVVEQIWPTVISNVKTPGKWWGTNETPFFKADVPDDAKKAIDEDYASSGRKAPSDIDYVREYNRMMFLKHFGPKKETP